MANDTKFIDGLIVKAPNDNAPEYVKAKLSIKREEMIAWLQQQTGDWINADIKVSQGGKWYAAVDDWKPNQDGGAGASRRPPSDAAKRAREALQKPAPAAANEFVDDDIPF